MSIPLPPIPDPYFDTWPLTPEKLRARDLKVARVVLEAAGKMCRDAESGLWEVYKRGDGALKKGRGSEYVQGAADQSALLADAVVNLEFHHE
jgi:hypothetical protein